LTRHSTSLTLARLLRDVFPEEYEQRRAEISAETAPAAADCAGDVLPHFDGLVDEDGRVHGMAMARRLVAHPSEIAAWTRLARGANAARRGLVPAVTAMLADAA
jgi:hypothetical protein